MKPMRHMMQKRTLQSELTHHTAYALPQLIALLSKMNLRPNFTHFPLIAKPMDQVPLPEEVVVVEVEVVAVEEVTLLKTAKAAQPPVMMIHIAQRSVIAQQTIPTTANAV